jgi:hypothetical protein
MKLMNVKSIPFEQGQECLTFGVWRDAVQSLGLYGRRAGTRPQPGRKPARPIQRKRAHATAQVVGKAGKIDDQKPPRQRQHSEWPFAQHTPFHLLRIRGRR